MERYCQHLGKLVKSRRHPDRTMANATLVEIRVTATVAKYPKFNNVINPPPVSSSQTPSARKSIELDGLTLHSPTTNVSIALNPTFRSHLVGYFATRFPNSNGTPASTTTVKRHLPIEVDLWSQVKLDEGRDVVNAAKLSLPENEEPDHFARDSTYFIYTHLVDKFEDDQEHEVELEKRDEIARCEQIFTAVYRGTRYELAWIRPCKSKKVESGLLYFPTGGDGFRQREVIDLRLIRGAVGRVRHGESFFIVDRSSETLIPTFDGDLEQPGFLE